MKGFRAPELPPLSPLGTARQRLPPGPRVAAGAGDTPADDAREYPIDLLALLRDVDLGEESLFLAWQAAAWAEGLAAPERRALAGVFTRQLCAVAQGSTRLRVAGDDRALLARAPEVVGTPGQRRPFILDGDHLYQQRLLACEDRLAAALAARARADADVAPLVDDAQADRAVQAVLATAAPRPTPEQAAVIRAALQGRLTVVSGGPGTGKTTIVLAIVRALARLGVPPASLALAAPTGKAANRLAEALRAGLDAMGARADETDRRIAAAPPEAQTIHRLLGYSPRAGTFQHHQNNLLAEKVIIVDESSMIDLALMERLSRAVAADARLVLLGDADQLASVEAGAVFRDLGPLARRLTGSHRVDAAAEAGRRLLQLAAAVKSGALDTPIPERPTATDLTFTGAELLPPTALPDLLSRWHDHLWPPSSSPSSSSSLAHHLYRLEDGRFPPDDADRLTLLQRHVQSVRILCVTRGRPTGAVAVNEWLRRRHRGGSGAPFAPGEPVMMLRNDYDRGLFNGDQGVVIHLRDDTRTARLGAAFPTRTGWQAWPLDSFGESLELSYAMTVHKAQGSEHDRVALILPDVPIPLLTRELLYTAITRARHAVVICGSTAVLAAGVAARLERSSGLGEKLRLTR